MSHDMGTSGLGDRLAPVLRPVRAGNGFEEALEQILQVVRLGLVPGGERLPAERELAERLGISRVTLREVLKVLQDQGLGGGAARAVRRNVRAAARPDAGGEDELRRRIAEVDIEDVLRFREVLEVGAAGLCAAHGLSGEQAERLREALERTHEAPLADYRRADTLLHLTLAELCGSPSLTAQYAAVRATVNDLLDCIPLLVRNLEHSAAAAHGAGGGGAGRGRGRGAGDDARALRGDGGAAAGLPGVNRPHGGARKGMNEHL